VQALVSSAYGFADGQTVTQMVPETNREASQATEQTKLVVPWIGVWKRQLADGTEPLSSQKAWAVLVRFW